MKKETLLSILIALPIFASAFNGKAKVGGIWYNIVTKAEKAEVTKPDVGNYSGIIKIPSTIVYEGVTCKVTSIGDGAFAYGNITSVTIPNTVTKIKTAGFRWCQNLKSITIPSSVTEIESAAFNGCSALVSVSLSQNLKKIDNAVFQGCLNLKTVVIPDGVTKIDMYAFEGCKNLASVTLSNKLDSICSDAFASSGITSISIPSSVRIIEQNAFSGCTKLKTITLGSGIEKISFAAFEKCGDLKDFYIERAMLPNIVNNAPIFRGSEVEYATLYVPASSIDDYKAVEPWNKFGKIVANPNVKGEETGKANEASDETIHELMDCQGQIPTPHIPRYELQQWLDEKVIYPQEAKAKGISGSVTVVFVVEPDGSISNVEAVGNNAPELVPEAVRVVKSMPKWNPGKVNGKYARVKDSIGVNFRR